MASDLKIDIDNVRLNIRVGAIFRFNDEVVIEISKVGANSVVPGGRIKINEDSKNALKREMLEEMQIEIDVNKLRQIKVFENFFNLGGKDCHEIFFLYEYNLSDIEAQTIRKLDINNDNETTYFSFVSKNEDFEKYNLLPLNLREIIKSGE